MIKKFLSKLFDSNEKQINSVQPVIDQINSLEKNQEKKSIEDFKKRIDEMRKELKPLVDKVPKEDKASTKTPEKGSNFPDYESKIQEKLQEFLPELYAIIREVTRRTYKRGDKFIKQYDVQMIAATILSYGQKLVELKTGEGKTLVFMLPAALYSLTDRGAHVITVNDYLARRDGEYAGYLLSELGFTVGIITPEKAYKFITDDEIKQHKGEETYKERKETTILDPGDTKGLNLIEVDKKTAYDCDIVYGTNNEFGFDYLRDNMAQSIDSIVQKELYFCIVDEADSILIDEARTPLIISAPADESNELYKTFARLIPQLEDEKHYTIDEKAHSAVLTDEGAVKMEKLLKVKNIWEDYKLAHHMENALKAYTLYKSDDEYLVRDGEVHIVDQFTGRVLKGRRYSEGLHQAIEAKEKVEIKRESKTLATITFQNFFRLYKILSGGSGTIMTEAEEFFKIYSLDSLVVPTNKPVIRKDDSDRVYKNQEAKFNAIVEEIIERTKKGQPVLVGTTSIENSEIISNKLDKKGVEHEVLNAKYHERESHIVANGGKKGSITVATNMAGRGTDIKLGGSDATEAAVKDVLESGGLHIIGSERHESRRVDNQLRGRSGRQGDPGSSRFYVALDDEIMRIQGGAMVQKLMEMTKIPDDVPIEAGLIGRSIENAQKKVEGVHFDTRKQVVDYDDVVNRQREIFYKKRRGILQQTDELREKLKHSKDIAEDKDYKKLGERVLEILNTETDFIVQKHFLPEREDNIDKKQLVSDYLDLADDELIAKGIKNGEKKNIKGEEVGKHINNKLEKKNQEEILTYLEGINRSILNSKIKEYHKDFPLIMKTYYLQTLDQGWSEHLDAMTDLRQGIGLRGYAQRDPLVEYKNEGFHLFDKFISKSDSNFSRVILKIKKAIQSEKGNQNTNLSEVEDVLTGDREMEIPKFKGMTRVNTTSSKSTSVPTKKAGKKIGRNDQCPCGSGLKYKKCGLVNSPKHKIT